MHRFLLGFVFSLTLAMSGTASALVMTSGEVPLLDHYQPPAVRVLQNFGELVATDIQLIERRPTIPLFGRRDFDWVSEPPFEWPRPEWSHEPGSWMEKFPLLANFLSVVFGEHHDFCRHDEPTGDPVPEPTTALLFGAGLLGLGLMRRRQR